jgi:hypothetical protein
MPPAFRCARAREWKLLRCYLRLNANKLTLKQRNDALTESRFFFASLIRARSRPERATLERESERARENFRAKCVIH